MMDCPICGCEGSRVTDSRPTRTHTIRRRRFCDNPPCLHRWTTYEILAADKEAAENLVVFAENLNALSDRDLKLLRAMVQEMLNAK